MIINSLSASLKVTIVLFVFLQSSISVAQSDFYLQRLKAAEITAEALAETKKLIQDYKKQVPASPITLSPFHKRSKREAMDAKEFCLLCHGSLPHKNNVRNRTFLNQHTEKLSCQTCHLNIREGEKKSITYGWLLMSGPQMGTELAISASENTSGVEPLDSAHLKIAPFDQGKRISVFDDEAIIVELHNTWEGGDADERAEIHLQLHSPLKRDAYNCSHCHTGSQDDDLLDLHYLGLSEEKIDAIRLNSIAHFFSRYKEPTQQIQLIDLLRSPRRTE